MIMYQQIIDTLNSFAFQHVSEERKAVLHPLTQFIQRKIDAGDAVNLSFICTHNSRRSHLSQVWAQVAACYFGLPQVNCYSGGTEETALFPLIASTLDKQGFKVSKLADTANPIYAIKYADDCAPIVGFSKRFGHAFNPSVNYAAIMTCSQADEGCPFVLGADQRFPITFDDPKMADGTPEQEQVYTATSLQIAAEMFHVFAGVKGFR